MLWKRRIWCWAERWREGGRDCDLKGQRPSGREGAEDDEQAVVKNLGGRCEGSTCSVQQINEKDVPQSKQGGSYDFRVGGETQRYGDRGGVQAGYGGDSYQMEAC